MPGTTILWVILLYVAIAVLLLSMNLTSRWRWWVKAAAIIVTGGFFVGSYFALVALLGWPSTDDPPPRFALLSTRVVEPDRITGAAGAIYLWLEEIDENNIPSGKPRSYGLAYTQDFANAVSQARDTTHYLPFDAVVTLLVTPQPSQDSSLMSPLAASNALLVRMIDAPACKAGDEVDVLAMDF